MTNERIEAFFHRWVPVWVIGSLVASLLLRFVAQPLAWIGYILAGTTFLAALLAFLFAFSSPPAARTREQLGFARERDYWFYQWSAKGLSAEHFILGFGCVLVSLVTGWGETAPGLLALANVFLLIAVGWLTRKWPGDRKGSG